MKKKEVKYRYLRLNEIMRASDEFELLGDRGTFIRCKGWVGHKRMEMGGPPRVRRKIK